MPRVRDPRYSGGLALGTAQLGMNYGIANRSGRPSSDEAVAILDAAWDAGVRVFDTAPGYGAAEELLGDWLAERAVTDAVVVTKLDASVDAEDAEAVVAAVKVSRKHLRGALDCLLLHDAAAVSRWPTVAPALQTCVERGLVRRVGVSVYEPGQFAEALRHEEISVVQAPASALDRRLVDSGMLANGLASGRAIVLRSVFLQGALTLPPSELPKSLAFAAPTVERWSALCKRHGLAPEEAALRYVRTVAPDALVLVGCESRSQVTRNVALWRAGPLDEPFVADLVSLPPTPNRLLDPRTWDEEAENPISIVAPRAKS
jgi:aryl-alcohol dehydrogenase-like predicted oxidoreductase